MKINTTQNAVNEIYCKKIDKIVSVRAGYRGQVTGCRGQVAGDRGYA